MPPAAILTKPTFILQAMPYGSDWKNLVKAWAFCRPYVENLTGPVMLSRAIAAYERSGAGDMTILPPGTVYPADWRDSHEWGSDHNEMRVCNPYHLGFDEVQCIGKFRDAYALTFWTKSWTA